MPAAFAASSTLERERSAAMKSFSFCCLFPPSRPETVSFRLIPYHFRTAGTATNTRPWPMSWLESFDLSRAFTLPEYSTRTKKEYWPPPSSANVCILGMAGLQPHIAPKGHEGEPTGSLQGLHYRIRV